MHERRHLNDLSEIMIAQRLQRLSARTRLADATDTEAQCRADEDAAEEQVSGTLTCWVNFIQQRVLDPNLLAGLAATLEVQDAGLRAAKQQREGAQRDTEAARYICAQRDVQLEQTSTAMRRSRRRLARRASESAMSTVEERTTYEWVQS